MKKLLQIPLLLCLALSSVYCSDKNEELPPVTTPLRPITPGFPPIRPRITTYPTMKFAPESKQISFIFPENTKSMKVSISMPDGNAIDTIVTPENCSIMFNPDKGAYSITATTDDGMKYMGKISL